MKLRYLFIFIFAVFAFSSCAGGSGGAAPVPPMSVPTTVEYAGAGMVVEMNGSMALSADADFTGGAVKFTDLGTGEEDTTGVCGTAAISGADITITGPGDWPNDQSRCQVCFQYEGSCLPVTYNASASIVSLAPEKVAPNVIEVEKDSSANTAVMVVVPNVDMSIHFTDYPNGVDFSGIENNLPNPANDVSYLIMLQAASFSSGLGTTDAVEEQHVCGIRLEDTGSYFARRSTVHMVTTKDLSTVTDYNEVSRDLYNECKIDVGSDANGNKIVAMAVVGCLLDECSIYDRSMSVFIGDGTGSFANIHALTLDPLAPAEGSTLYIYDVAVDSNGNGVVAYYLDEDAGGVDYDKAILYQICSAASCGDPQVVADGIYFVDDGYYSAGVTVYQNVVHFVYSKEGVNGIANLYHRTLSAGTLSDEEMWVAGDETRGNVHSPQIAVYTPFGTGAETYVITYNYTDVPGVFAKAKVTTSSGVTTTDEVQLSSSPTAVADAPIIVESGDIYFTYSESGEAYAEPYAISSNTLTPRSNPFTFSAVLNYESTAYVYDSVYQSYLLYAKSVESGDGYTPAGLGRQVGSVVNP